MIEHKVRLLLIDDDTVDRIAVRRAIGGAGLNADVIDAQDPQSAMEALKHDSFDCVLLDYQLPGIDGMQLLRTLRSAGILCPVVVLTGQGGEQIAVDLMKAGAADYLQKQHLTPDRLGRSLRYALALGYSEEQRRELLARERTAREQAEAANRAKDEFLATLSHELRTPLNAILGWSRLIATGNLDARSLQRAIEVIDRNVRVQAQLINDLLDISRIITGKLRLDMRPVRLHSVVAAAVETVTSAAEAKGIEIETSVPRELRAVTCDPARIQQIVWNLLSNAVKFTPGGGRVSLHVEEVPGSIVITVRDTGIGISPEFLPYVFDRFTQQDGATTRSHGGLGLGLSIVRHLVELHGGTVNADSAGDGCGAAFAVTLPFNGTPQEKPASETGDDGSAEGGYGIARRSVLLVDPDTDTRVLVATVLEQHGAIVGAVESAAEALAVVERLQPQILLVDFDAMTADGAAALVKDVRALGTAIARLPAIGMCSVASSEDRIRALLSGYQMCLPKPIDSRELVAAVAALAQRNPIAAPDPTRV